MYKDKYPVLYMPNHHKANMYGFVREHVLVAEKILGRNLEKEECVHHIDFNKENNDENNLMIFKTLADHMSYHKGGKAVKNGDVWECIKLKDLKNICKHCNKEFYTNYKNPNYCSIECFYESIRRVERPDKQTLYSLIIQKTFIEIGSIYGVSDNAIRKWCKAYGLPYKKKDIQKIINQK